MSKMQPTSLREMVQETKPSLEDQYRARGYTYNAERNVWEAPLMPAAPPAKPVNGDVWIDNTNADMYVYCEDYHSDSWIQVGGSASGR